MGIGRRKGAMVLLLLVSSGLLLGYIYWGTTSLAVRHYTIAIADLPGDFAGFTILHLSDLHNKEYGPGQEKLLAKIKSQEFDIIAITGDIIDKRNPDMEPVLELLQGLKGEEIFFVPGNHEHWAGYEEIKSALAEEGVTILENAGVRYERGGSHLWLLGVDDPYSGRARLDKALAAVDDSQPRILLAHAPEIFPAAVAADCDLVLVGHTHGGQIRLPFLGAVVAPGQGFFPSFDYGLFTSGRTTLLVNGGLGESVIPVRFNLRPEIVVITLVPAGEAEG